MRKPGLILAMIATVAALMAISTLVAVRTFWPPETKPTAARTTPPPPTVATYAVRLPGSRALVAMTVRGGRAVAYVCDGQELESWFGGEVYPGGMLQLKARKGEGVITAAVQGDAVVGAASLSRDHAVVGFRAPVVKPPSGLYRGVASAPGAQIVGGWIVLPNRQQVGMVNVNGAYRAAPPFDPATGQVTVDGVPVKVAPAAP